MITLEGMQEECGHSVGFIGCTLKDIADVLDSITHAELRVLLKSAGELLLSTSSIGELMIDTRDDELADKSGQTILRIHRVVMARREAS